MACTTSLYFSHFEQVLAKHVSRAAGYQGSNVGWAAMEWLEGDVTDDFYDSDILDA